MVKIKEYKLPQHNQLSRRFLNPQKLTLPLSQHTGGPSQAVVKVGEVVEEAALIAEASGFISSVLHAPKKGKVFAIEGAPHHLLGRDKSITLSCLQEEKRYQQRRDIDSLGAQQLLEIVRDSGIVGMGGASFPAHVKLKPPRKIDTLIINGCECEPYLGCDYRLMVENTHGIFKGVELISKILSPRQVIFALEDNKPEAIKKINLSVSTRKYNLPRATMVILKSHYPQGAEKQLIHSLTRRKVPRGKLPFEVGCLVHNVATCFAIYEAVHFSKPLIERIVTFAGDSLTEPKNLWVKIGTQIKELFDAGVLAFKNDPQEIIFGGPMMGIAVDSLEYPVLKGTSGVLFLSQQRVDKLPEDVCIRCARCVDSCPMQLLPFEYVKRVTHQRFNLLEEVFIKDCIECGCCAAVCPAKIPICHYIKIGKQNAANS